MKKLWEIWKYSLGSFSDTKTENYDDWVAIVRTCIFVSYMVTNIFIVSGVIRHWNDVHGESPVGRAGGNTFAGSIPVLSVRK